jgi:predicted RND superfamily exporter protein
VTYLPDPKTSRDLPTIMRRKIAAKILDDSLPHFDELGVLRTTEGDQTWRITAFVSAVEPLDYGRFVARVRQHIDPLLKDDEGHELANVAASYTGIMPLVHEIQRQLLRDLYDSFVSGFTVITIAMTIVQGGLLTALIPMITNIFPTLIMFGTLGWLGLSLDIGSVMTASIALGLAIDDELHYLTFFRRELEKGRSIRDAIRLGYRHCGVAMTQTSVTCAVGLSVFSLSEFIPTSRFGWVMAILIALALFADLLLLPALLFSPLGRFFLPSNVSATANVPVITPRNEPDGQPNFPTRSAHPAGA